MLSTAEPPGCLCETWAGAKSLHPSFPWWLPVPRCRREAWCRQHRFSSRWFRMVAFVLAVLPAQSHFLAAVRGPGRCWRQRVGEAALLLCGEKRAAPTKPQSRLPQRSQAGLGGRERRASSCKHAWAGGSCPILTETTLCPRNSLRAFGLDKHLTCSGALSTAWILGMHFVTTALPHCMVTCWCSVQGGVSTGHSQHCSMPQCRQDACTVVQRQARNIPAPSFGGYCLVNYHENPSARFFPTVLVKPCILQGQD